jgi:hypothetical protein
VLFKVGHVLFAARRLSAPACLTRKLRFSTIRLHHFRGFPAALSPLPRKPSQLTREFELQGARNKAVTPLLTLPCSISSTANAHHAVLSSIALVSCGHLFELKVMGR